MARGRSWPRTGERVEIPGSKEPVKGGNEKVLEEVEKRTISYFPFHSSGCGRGCLTPGQGNICILRKGLFAFSETDANERVLPGWKDAKESRLCSAGPFCESFSSQRLTFSSYMMHLSCKQYPAISLSNSLVIRRGHCAPALLFLSLPPYLPLSRNCVLQNNPFATLVQLFRV